MSDESMTTGYIITVGRVTDAAYRNAGDLLDKHYCDIGQEVLLSPRSDRELSQKVHVPNPFVRPPSEEDYARRVARLVVETKRQFVAAVVFPLEMLQWKTPYGARPRLFVKELNALRPKEVAPLFVLCTHADDSVTELRYGW